MNAVVRRTRTQFGRRAFAVSGPDIWNTFPPAIRTKTYLFHLAFNYFLFVFLSLTI